MFYYDWRTQCPTYAKSIHISTVAAEKRNKRASISKKNSPYNYNIESLLNTVSNSN